MKQYILFCLFCLVTHLSLAQNTFEYDQAGNRIKRNLKPVPDLTPILQVIPNSIVGTTAIRAKIMVEELLNVSTSGLITVLINKDALCPLSFNQSTITGSDGTTIQNPNWTFNSNNPLYPGYYTLTSTIPITASSNSIIELSGVLNPGGTSGTLTFTVTINGGSGGETNDLNNTDTDPIRYFAR